MFLVCFKTRGVVGSGSGIDTCPSVQFTDKAKQLPTLIHINNCLCLGVSVIIAATPLD